jgi:uncharacterized protein YfeS
MNEDEHDPWNEVAHRHPRARELMADSLWDCTDEDAPFGSDEGADAYSEFRDWRAENPGAPLQACLDWIGDQSAYPDAFTYDATIIATVLGQLVSEGRIDEDAKPAAYNAIARQISAADEHRLELLKAVEAAIQAG